MNIAEPPHDFRLHKHDGGGNRVWLAHIDRCTKCGAKRKRVYERGDLWGAHADDIFYKPKGKLLWSTACPPCADGRSHA